MKKNKRNFGVFLALIVFLTLSFLPIIQAEENSISQNKPVSNEMTVYFIRDKAFYGAARRVWMACNEKVLASIASGSYCCFKVTEGPNIINAVQAKSPAGFYLLKYNPDETIYLLYDYTKGTITQVAQYVGEQLVKDTNIVPILEKTEPNDAYEFSLINPGFFDIELMKKAEEIMTPDSDNAVITFIRPEEFLKNVPFGVWSEDGYLGTLRGHTYLQIKVKPGKHLFIGKSEGFSVLEANVEAGKNYYIQFKSGIGKYLARIQLLPVKKETDDKTIQKWLESSTHVTYNQNSVTSDLQTVLDKAKIIIDEAFQKAEKGEIKTEKLFERTQENINKNLLEIPIH